ncbi:hypothetical protein BH11BAC2_BH11BAC2_09710 [soil metagenome]
MAKKPSVLFYVTFAMTSIYILMGLFLIIAPISADLFPGWKRNVFGGLLIGYGGFRMLRLQKIRKTMEEESKG